MSETKVEAVKLGSDNSDQRISVGLSGTYNLYGMGGTQHFNNGILQAVAQQQDTPADSTPRSGSAKAGITQYPHPILFDAVYALKDISGHHSSCIQAKKYATVGLGFIDDGDDIKKAETGEEAAQQMESLLSGRGHVQSKVDDTLDPCTNFGFMNELLDACEDFMDGGTGYLEVHRDDSGEINGITQIPARDLWACTFDGHLYYMYRKPGGTTQYWALFGKSNREWLMSDAGPFREGVLEPENVSEVIPFIQPSNRVKFYGYPDWLSASVDIDLLKKAKQYKADFYHNRGVIDKILVVSGEQVNSDAWGRIESAFKGTIGEGNNFNSIAMNFAKEGVTCTVENVGADQGTEEQFAKDLEALTQNIVSSHGVPPLLANILIPGKLGASNEFLNALMGFQLLRVNAYQNVFEKMLAKTLGGDDGFSSLGADDFKLRTITSQIDIPTTDTIGKMRSEVSDPKNADRDLKKGVKD